MLETTARELGLAVRALARSPVFTAVATLSLALGIGVCTAVFSVVSGFLFRPLPYHEADQLVDIHEHHATEVCAGCSVGTSYANFIDFRARSRSFAGMAAYREDWFVVAAGDGAERRRGARVTADLFAVLGVPPLSGRPLGPADEAPGAARVVVLGEVFWRVRFGGRPVEGRTLRIDGESYTVIGVMPVRFAFPERAELWVALDASARASGRADRNVGVVGRVARGRRTADARAEIGAIGRQLEQEHAVTNGGWQARVQPLRADLAADYAGGFQVLLGAVTFVLLIACANLANLLLARASTRRQELALRVALGAGRAALARGPLAESMLLAAAGGAAGLLVARWGIVAIEHLTAGALPPWLRYDVDVRVAAFGIALALATGLLFGALPALEASRTAAGLALGAGGRGVTGERSRARTRRVLVIGQVAAAVVLVIGAGLLTRTFLRVRAADAGHSVERLYRADLTLPAAATADPARVAGLADAFLARLRSGGGTDGAALSSLFVVNWPGTPPAEVRIDGLDAAQSAGAVHHVHNITPDWFRTLGIRMLEGRTFTDADQPGAPRVAIVNRALADRLWPGGGVLGRQLHLGGPADDWTTVVGVVDNVPGSPLGRGTPGLLYLPLAQHPQAQPNAADLSLVVRLVPGAPPFAAAVRTAAASLDDDVVTGSIMSVEQWRAQWVAPAGAAALLVGGLGAFAALLAGMGIHGVIAFLVARRTHEMGVRMAMGATRRRLVRMVIGEGVALAVAGIAIGTPAALAATRVLRGFLFGTSPTDPAVFATVAAGFIAVAALASWLPARRAARVDPIVALRQE